MIVATNITAVTKIATKIATKIENVDLSTARVAQMQTSARATMNQSDRRTSYD